MSLDAPITSWGEWLAQVAPHWGRLFLTLLGLGLLLGYVFAAARLGPIEGARTLLRFVSSAFLDVVRMSPRRVYALARLAVLESIRRMVLVGFLVFVVVLLFAGWYLDPSGANPAKLYLSFVLSATGWLTTLLAIFLSVFSLPADLRNKTIYTVVTKPVRPSEIVLGRILGFMAIGTVMLTLTGVASYFFVTRGLDHTHEVLETTLEPEKNREGPTGITVGRTSQVQNHRHQVRLSADGSGQTSYDQGHFHEIKLVASGGRERYVLGPPQGLLQARVPVYAKEISFLNRQGEEDLNKVQVRLEGGQEIARPAGIDVGKEKKRQGWIEGGTQAASIWEFEGLREEDFPEGLPLELNLGVFRTAAGDVGQGVLGSIVLKSPAAKKGDPQKSSAPRNFVAQEYKSDLQFIGRKLQTTDGQPLDLWTDLVVDGKLEVWVTCLQVEQYLGMARTDLYVRAPDASFATNFVKGYATMWLQMLVVTCLGVTLSTFLNSAVALLGTLVIMIGGFVKPYILDVAADRVLGGGPLESLVRTVLQINQTVPLEPGLSTTIVERFDQAYRGVLQVASGAVPDLASMSTSTIVAQGYSIPLDPLIEQGFAAVAYVIPVFLCGFVFFKLREVAR